MDYNPTQNLIDNARKVADELDGDEARLVKRRRILSGGLRVYIRNLEAALASAQGNQS